MNFKTFSETAVCHVYISSTYRPAPPIYAVQKEPAELTICVFYICYILYLLSINVLLQV